MHHYSNDCVCDHYCKSWLGPNSGQDHQFWYLMAIVYNQISDHQTEIVIVKRFHIWLFHLLSLLFSYFISSFHLILITLISTKGKNIVAMLCHSSIPQQQLHYSYKELS